MMKGGRKEKREGGKTAETKKNERGKGMTDGWSDTETRRQEVVEGREERTIQRGKVSEMRTKIGGKQEAWKVEKKKKEDLR